MSLCPTHRVQHGLAEDDVLHRSVLQQLHVRHRRLSAREHASKSSKDEHEREEDEHEDEDERERGKTSMSEGRGAWA